MLLFSVLLQIEVFPCFASPGFIISVTEKRDSASAALIHGVSMDLLMPEIGFGRTVTLQASDFKRGS